MGFWQSPDPGLRPHHLMEDPMPGPLRSGQFAVVTLALLMVSACGAEEPSTADGPSTPESSATQSPTDQPSATTEPTGKPKGDAAGTTIDITFQGDKVDPSGVERKVKAGKPFTLHIVADQPGIVEVESHDLDRVIVQLEVR